MDDLRDSIKLDGETVFHHYISQHKGKLEIYNESLTTLHLQYGIIKHNIQYLVWLIDKHGFNVLRTNKNNHYAKEFKQETIDRVLINNETAISVEIDIGLPSDGLFPSPFG